VHEELLVGKQIAVTHDISNEYFMVELVEYPTKSL
jgi:hypothetical protein